MYRFVCVYNPPALAQDISHTTLLCSLFNHYCCINNPVFLVGDFDYPNIDWSIPMSLGSVSHETCTMQNGLTQIANCPTRGQNCIDLILVSNPGLVYETSVLEPFSSSCDHASIDFQIICPRSSPSSDSCSYFQKIYNL